MSDANLARFEISAAQIDRVVAVFYAAVRKDAVLGPVFANHVKDWPEHEEKIAAFWRNAILRERCYSGNPMRVHVSRPDVKADHFPIWLGLFHSILQAELPPEIARQWGALADRVGEGFRTGITAMRQPKDEPPKLF
ncbi:group III truncated hemoglobin [Epibacterium ulvae]|uniref:group III truncated hemoglobin n=1 Tax=Epibacterium ulvae TaxID=1156985 RepID=UPI0024918A58|nr:group III truncated hemoglobin [Epibacterium ulvae]